MEINFVPKKCRKYSCIVCDYHTSNKKDFDKHSATRKHTLSVNGNTLEIKKSPKIPTFVCSCNRVFKSNSGLWKHKQKCSLYSNNESNLEEKNNHDNESPKHQPTSEINMMKDMMMEMFKSNSDLQQVLLDQNKTLVELSKIQRNTNITHTNSHNRSFNLNFFLNEQCKDAMNISEFVSSVKLQLTDLEAVGQLGYVDGITDIIVKNLKALDIYKRPIHTSDIKREVMYVKDQNKWEKEDADKTRIKNTITHIAHKNAQMLMDYKTEHPDCELANSTNNDIYSKLMMAAYDNNSDNECRIIKKLAKEVSIDKLM